nr:iron chelate uptake ABC transporter family permease subunit [Methanospirillum hungatei]
MQYLGTAQEVQAVVFLMIRLSKPKWDDITIITLIIQVSLPFPIYRASDITILSAGDETAHRLGINLERNRVIIMMIPAQFTAGTAFNGIIWSMGLISPSIVRLIIGRNNRYVLPSSALGRDSSSISDTVARTIPASLIIPVGIIIALIEAPFFVYPFLNQKKEYWQIPDEKSSTFQIGGIKTSEE